MRHQKITAELNKSELEELLLILKKELEICQEILRIIDIK